MKVKKYLKAVFAIGLTLAIFSCSENVSSLSINSTQSSKDTQSNNTGTIQINLADIFNKNNNSFSVKRYKFNDSKIETLKITVFRVDVDGNLLSTIERELKYSENWDKIYVNVPEGNNQVVIIQALDKYDFELTRLSASINVKVGISTTLKINYGTYPVATILKKLMDNADVNVRKLAQSINLDDLNTLLNKITGYDEYTNTYRGVHPAYVDLNAITNALIASSGVVPVYTRGLFDKELKGQLNIIAKDTTGNQLSSVLIKVNDLTSSSDNLYTKSDKVLEIEDISYGTWTVSASYGDKYAEQIITISDGNLIQNINFVMDKPVVQKIEFDELEDGVPLPATIQVSVGQSLNIKAKVTMTDRTTNTNIDWTSTDITTANVSSGTISGVKAGIVTIKAAARDNNAIFQTRTVKVVDKNTSPPSISSFLPTRASTGTTVTIKGSNFDDLQSVAFNGINSPTIDKKDDYTITAVIPNGATTGKVSVTTLDGTMLSQDFLIINAPANTDGQIYIPEGEFYMGNDGNADDDDFHPRHKVTLSGYHIDRTEVTNEEFEQFIIAGGYATQALWSPQGWTWKEEEGLTKPAYWDDTKFNQAKQPVVGVSWYEADAYARWKGRRLPSEAEWEKSGRGSDSRQYPWSGGVSSTYCNGYFGNLGKDDSYQFTANVASFANDASPYGLKDMSGNAYEWVNDWYNKTIYRVNHYDNPQGPGFGGSKVLRGGSWYNHPYFKDEKSKLDRSLTTYYRFYATPTNRSNYIGFRTAK